MKFLLDGCSFTEPWVSPEDWRTTKAKSSLQKNWYVQCKFYDPKNAEKYPNGFPFRRKLNKIKTLDGRQSAAELLMLEIPKLFSELGYNPITKVFSVEQKVEQEPLPDIEETMLPDTPFLIALDLAKKSRKLAESTETHIKYMLVKISKAVKELEMNEFRIFDVQRKHIRQIMDHLEKTEINHDFSKLNFSECEQHSNNENYPFPNKSITANQ